MDHRPAGSRARVDRADGPLLFLPADIWLLLTREYLGVSDVARLAQTCRRLRDLCAADESWSVAVRRARKHGIARKLFLRTRREKPFPRLPIEVCRLSAPASQRSVYARMLYFFYAVVLEPNGGRSLKYSVAHSRCRRRRMDLLLRSGLLDEDFLRWCRAKKEKGSVPSAASCAERLP